MSHRLTCLYCRGFYRAKRADSTTCSPACRTALHRARADAAQQQRGELGPFQRQKRTRYSAQRAADTLSALDRRDLDRGVALRSPAPRRLVKGERVEGLRAAAAVRDASADPSRGELEP